MILRVYWAIQGAEHVKCRVFVADQPLAQFAFAGELILRRQEFVALGSGKFQAEFFEEAERGNGG